MKKRFLYVDILRIVLMLQIVMLHSIAPCLDSFENSFDWHVSNLLMSNARFAIPIFFIIGGMLHLRKEVQFNVAYFKYMIFRLLGPFILALFIYKLFDFFVLKSPLGLFDGFLYNFSNSIGYHFWFMWTYFGLLLAAPIFSAILKDQRATYCFLLLWLVFASVVPTLNFFGIKFPIDNAMFLEHSVYFLLGGVLPELRCSLSRTKLFSIIIVCTICTALLAFIFSFRDNSINQFFYRSTSIFVFAGVIASFYFYKSFSYESNFFQKHKPIITNIAKSTYFIYLYHPILLRTCFGVLKNYDPFFNILIISPLVFIFLYGADTLKNKLLEVFFRRNQLSIF